MANNLVGQGLGIWVESWWQGNLLDRGIWGKSLLTDLSGQKCEVFVFYVSAHCRMTWAEQGFNSQMHMLVCQPLSSEPCHQPADSWAKWPWRQGWSRGLDSAAWFPLTKAHLASGHCVETNTEYRIWHRLPGSSASLWWQADDTRVLSL